MRSSVEILGYASISSDDLDITCTDPCWRQDNKIRGLQLDVLLNIRDTIAGIREEIRLVREGK